MKIKNSENQSSSSISRIGRAGIHILLAGTLALSPSLPASATTTYEVPAGGLSFDANGALEANPCTSGFGNSLGFADTDEVNGLIAGEFLTYRNVANIGGQAIDAKVTLTAISGMRAERSASVLDRIDKCDIDSKTSIMEMIFNSATANLGDEASFVLTIDFLANGSPATLTNLKMNVEDIDSNQYLEVDGFTSVSLASGRDSDNLQQYRNGDLIQVGSGVSKTLSTTATASRFHALGSEDGNGQAETDKHVAEITYASVGSLVLKLGVYESGSGSFDLNFKGFTFVATPEVISANPTPTPTPTPTQTPIAATPQLARTGAGEESRLVGLAGVTAILIAVGTILLYKRRKFI
jgi:LPXTG-motif cell wall-anchored protein